MSSLPSAMMASGCLPSNHSLPQAPPTLELLLQKRITFRCVALVQRLIPPTPRSSYPTVLLPQGPPTRRSFCLKDLLPQSPPAPCSSCPKVLLPQGRPAPRSPAPRSFSPRSARPKGRLTQGTPAPRSSLLPRGPPAPRSLLLPHGPPTPRSADHGAASCEGILAGAHSGGHRRRASALLAAHGHDAVRCAVAALTASQGWPQRWWRWRRR